MGERGLLPLRRTIFIFIVGDSLKILPPTEWEQMGGEGIEGQSPGSQYLPSFLLAASTRAGFPS